MCANLHIERNWDMVEWDTAPQPHDRFDLAHTAPDNSSPRTQLFHEPHGIASAASMVLPAPYKLTVLLEKKKKAYNDSLTLVPLQAVLYNAITFKLARRELWK